MQYFGTAAQFCTFLNKYAFFLSLLSVCQGHQTPQKANYSYLFRLQYIQSIYGNMSLPQVYLCINVPCLLMDLIMTCLACSPAASGN